MAGPMPTPPGFAACYFRARKVARRYFGARPDPLDDAGHAAVVGLLAAMRGTNRADGSIPGAYLDRCVHSACFAANLKRKRRAARLARVPMDCDAAGRESEPWVLAAIHEEGE